jgi:hypothetical protein
MNKRAISARFLSTALAIGLVAVGTSRADTPAGLDSPDGPFRASLGFGATVPDSDILALLQHRGTTPHAVHMWTTGLTGRYRTYRLEDDAQPFLQAARAKTVETLQKSLQGNEMRLRRFVETHTEQEVIEDPTLQTQARSLLNLHAQLQAGLVAAENGEPLIYSMEVSGDKAAVEGLSMDGMVKAFQPIMEMGAKAIIHDTPTPPAYQEVYLDPAVQAARADELYRMMNELGIIH